MKTRTIPILILFFGNKIDTIANSALLQLKMCVKNKNKNRFAVFVNRCDAYSTTRFYRNWFRQFPNTLRRRGARPYSNCALPVISNIAR